MRISIKLSQDALLALSFFIMVKTKLFDPSIYQEDPLIFRCFRFVQRSDGRHHLLDSHLLRGERKLVRVSPDVRRRRWRPIKLWLDSSVCLVHYRDDHDCWVRRALELVTYLDQSQPDLVYLYLDLLVVYRYGEIVPKSTLGRLVTVPLLVFGLLLIALPSFVLGRNFATVWDALRTAADEVIECLPAPGCLLYLFSNTRPLLHAPSSVTSCRSAQVHSHHPNLIPLLHLVILSIRINRILHLSTIILPLIVVITIRIIINLLLSG